MSCKNCQNWKPDPATGNTVGWCLSNSVGDSTPDEDFGGEEISDWLDSDSWRERFAADAESCKFWR